MPELIAAQESTTLTGMTTLASDIDPAVEKVVRACLNPDAAKRPGSALRVAAAGTREGLGRWWALLSLAVVVAGTFSSPVIRQGLRAMNHAPLEYTPEVLEQTARDLASEFGYPTLPKDRFLSIGRRSSVVSYMNRLPGPKKIEDWLKMESPLMAWYRESLGLIGFFFLFGAKMLLRRDWLATLAGAMFFPLIESSVVNAANHLPTFAMYFFVYGVMMWIMLRLGVVALMSTMFFLNLLGGSAMGTDLKAWYAPNGLVAIAILLMVAGWGFYRLQGGRDLLGPNGLQTES